MKQFLICLAILTGLALVSPALADVGEAPAPGGLITVGDKTDEIQMKSETVTFDIRESGDKFKYNDYYAHVTAEFTMVNLTDTDVTKQLIFPFHHANLNYRQETEQGVLDYVQINGVPADVTYSEYQIENSWSDQTIAYDTIASGDFEATFPADSETSIVIKYNLRGVNEPKSQNISFQYLMHTGSHWAGVIEDGTVIFNFWKPVDDNTYFAEKNDFFTAEDGKLIWNFQNLEPEVSDDIQLSFDPTLLTAWADRPTFLGSMSSSPVSEQQIWISAGIRDDEEMPGGYYPSGPYNTLSDDTDEYRGWFFEPVAGTTSSLTYSFNGNITLHSLDIKTGILAGWPGEHYNTFQRPKNVRLTFSDGTTQDVTLDDTPNQYQTVTITDKTTDSLKIEILDTYPGVGGGDQYLGIGRIQFSADASELNTNLAEQREEETQAIEKTAVNENQNTNQAVTATTDTHDKTKHCGSRKEETKLLCILIGTLLVSSILLVIIIR